MHVQSTFALFVQEQAYSTIHRTWGNMQKIQFYMSRSNCAVIVFYNVFNINHCRLKQYMIAIMKSICICAQWSQKLYVIVHFSTHDVRAIFIYLLYLFIYLLYSIKGRTNDFSSMSADFGKESEVLDLENFRLAATCWQFPIKICFSHSRPYNICWAVVCFQWHWILTYDRPWPSNLT